MIEVKGRGDVKLKHVERIFMGILAAGFLIALAGGTYEKNLLAGAGMAVMFGAVVFRIVLYRCPYCRKYLGNSAGKFCPFCGKEIE